RPIQKGDKLLLFLARPTDRDPERTVFFWVNLTKPDVRLTDNAAYNNDCKYLGDTVTILALVKKRIANEDPLKKVKKRGIILGFSDYKEGDLHWEFVRTADPDFKKVLVDRLKDEYWEVKE